MLFLKLKFTLFYPLYFSLHDEKHNEYKPGSGGGGMAVAIDIYVVTVMLQLNKKKNPEPPFFNNFLDFHQEYWM